MTPTTSQCITYTGRLEDLPTNASPGLQYLKEFFKVLVSAQPAIELLQTILASEAVSIQNGAAPIPAFPQACSIEQRAKGQKNPITSIKRELRCARDIEASEKTRSVTYEVVAEYSFETEGVSPVRIAEAGVIELRRAGVEDGEINEMQEYIATEIRAYLNDGPLKEKMMEIMALRKKGV